MRRSQALAAAIVAAALPAAALAAGPPGAGRDAGRAVVDAGAASDAGAAVNAGDRSDAGSAGATGDAGAVPSITCIEHVPQGARRPLMKETLPPRGVSGYAAELQLIVSHGKGETVLPEGFHLQAGSDAAKELEKAGFVIPDPSGGSAPHVTVAPGEAGSSITTITIPVVPLPPKAGRSVLVLPPLPIAIARANNEYVTVCTAPHLIQIEDPTSNELDPKVKANPPGRPQREDWPLARDLAIGVPAGVALALLGALGYRAWRRRPRFVPEPPRIPPWVSALEELSRIRRSSLLSEGKRGEHFDQVSDTIRRYLGARYGFDALGQANGLETTTGEMIELLERVRPPVVELPRIKDFLGDCDLVKFARFTPTEEHCLEALAHGEAIVRRTIPVMQLPSAKASEARDARDARDAREPREPRDEGGSAPPPEGSS